MNYTDGPECDTYCHGNPQFENDANLVMAWDGGHWSDSGATFKCVNGIYSLSLITISLFHFTILSNLAETYFDVPKPTSVISLYKSCHPDPSNDSNTGWFYKHPVYESLQKQLPSCVKICPEDPPEENDDFSRSWIKEYLSVGASATFKCKDNGKQFYLKYLYKTITMICTDTEIGTVWIWKDQKGKDQTTLPECKVRLEPLDEIFTETIQSCRNLQPVPLFKNRFIHTINSIKIILLTTIEHTLKLVDIIIINLCPLTQL